MALLTSIVDLESIQVPNSDFNPKSYTAEIEALARTMVHLQASIHIPVVRSLGIDEYELVSDHLTYYAYLKAREFDQELPEQLMVFIMEKNNEADIRRQLEVTEKIHQASRPDPVHTKGAESTNSDLRLDNLEGQVKQSSEQMKSAIAQLKAEMLEAIDAKLPRSIPALEAFNRILEPKIAHDALKKMEFLNSKKAQEIISKLQEFKQNHPDQEFKTFAEVAAAVGKNNKGQRLVTEGTLIKLIDRWN
jgi:hypothetical protein